jgi:hypothetical protein
MTKHSEDFGSKAQRNWNGTSAVNSTRGENRRTGLNRSPVGLYPVPSPDNTKITDSTIA